MIEEGRFGEMVCLKGSEITSIPLDEVIGAQRLVDPETDELVQVARDMGISFGDVPVKERL